MTWPLIVTRPWRIKSSQARREPIPAWARIFWSRSGPTSSPGRSPWVVEEDDDRGVTVGRRAGAFDGTKDDGRRDVVVFLGAEPPGLADPPGLEVDDPPGFEERRDFGLGAPLFPLRGGR
jgi:hypothetical protein